MLTLLGIIDPVLYRQKTRTRADYKPEFAALKLPTHPVTRYSDFRNKWKATRKTDHAPTPANKKKTEVCCFQCLKLSGALPPGQLPNRLIWEKKANHRWLDARWIWDFGFLLPAGLSEFGIGESPDIAGYLERKDTIFANQEDGTSIPVGLDSKNALTLDEHAALTGDDLHYTRVLFHYPPSFEGELVADGVTNLFYVGLSSTQWKLLKPPTEAEALACTFGDANAVGGFVLTQSLKIQFRISESKVIEI